MISEYIFLLLTAFAVLGLIFKNTKSKNKKNQEPLKMYLDEPDSEISEISEEGNEIKTDEIIYLTVGGIITRDYVTEILKKNQPTEIIEESIPRKYGVFTEIDDHTAFYGETEEEGSWEEQQEQNEEENENEGGGREVQIKKETVEKESVKERKMRAQRMIEDKKRKKQEDYYQAQLAI